MLLLVFSYFYWYFINRKVLGRTFRRRVLVRYSDRWLGVHMISSMWRVVKSLWITFLSIQVYPVQSISWFLPSRIISVDSFWDFSFYFLKKMIIRVSSKYNYQSLWIQTTTAEFSVLNYHTWFSFLPLEYEVDPRPSSHCIWWTVLTGILAYKRAAVRCFC